MQRRNFVTGLGLVAVGAATGAATADGKETSSDDRDSSDDGDSSDGDTVDADVVLKNAEIRTVDRYDSIEEALAILNGDIIRVGSNQDVEPHEGSDTEVIDLDGKTVIPGLQDSHIHFTPLGWELENVVDFTFAVTQDEVLTQLEEYIENNDFEEGEWIQGNRWDEYKYPSGEMVTRWQLDELAPDNPVQLDRVYRGIAVNTAVFERMGINPQDPETWPDWWLEDPDDFTFEDQIAREQRTIETVDGETIEEEVPSGWFIGSLATDLVTERAPGLSSDETVESIQGGATEMLSLGTTSVIVPSVEGGDEYQEASDRGLLQPLRVGLYEGTIRTHDPDTIPPRLEEREDEEYFGPDPYLSMDGVKYYADGGSGTRSSWVSEPFNNWQDLEGEKNFGNPVIEDDAVRKAQFKAAVDRGWDLHTHATGDMAMRQTTDLYMEFMDEIWDRFPEATLRWSIEHAYLPIEEKTMVGEDMAEYGITASIQPNFNWQLGESFRQNLGEDRVARVNPVKSYLDAGVPVASGSDYGVANHDPWLQLYAMLTRTIQGSEEVAGPEERVGVNDALRTMTYYGAYIAEEEDIRGSLEEGKVADFTVLDIESLDEAEEDPSIVPDMGDRVLWTVVEGKTGYQAEEFSGPAEDPAADESEQKQRLRHL